MTKILDTQLMHPAEQVALVISRVYSMGLTTTSGGNISVIDEDQNIWITPSGIDKGSLTASDIVCVRADGTIDGKHKPSSEFPFHEAIYKTRKDIKAIIHAHSPALVSFSIVRKIPNTNIIFQAKKICGEIGYAPYALPGSKRLGLAIAAEFGKGFSAIIMENHGTVVGGGDLSDAFERFETLEFCARTEIYSSQIGEPSFLSARAISEHGAQYRLQLPEQKSVSYPSAERGKRQEICSIVKRACRHGLMKSSYGTVSARWHGNDFLITPNGIPRWDLRPEDIVQIRDGKREYGKQPSLTAFLHQEIYNRHPDVNSIILTQSPYLMAFAVSGVDINVRTIPESWIFLKDMPQLEFGAQFEEPDRVVNSVSRERPAVLLKNECVLVVGDELLQTFDYLEVAEFSAKSIVMSATIGQMVPISEEQTQELRSAFLGGNSK
jgi:L-fuculose-phosphate aldolase